MARGTAALLCVLVLAATAGAQPYPEGDTLEERQRWAREHPDYQPFKLPLSTEDRAKYVACEENWTTSCDAMRTRYQEKAAAAIGGDQLPKADLAIQQKWAKQNPDWMPLGVPMSVQDRNNYVICVEQPSWEGCGKIKATYDKVKKEMEADKEKGVKEVKVPDKNETSGAAPDAASTGGGNTGADKGFGATGASIEGADAKTPKEPEVPDAEAAAERARAGGGKAMGGAAGLGDALKKDMNRDAGALPGGADRAGKAAGAPQTDHDLMLAAYSGYGGSLTALGLVVGKDASGRPSLRRADGSAATAEDLAALRARIAAEPSALMRRPDFFSKLPRARFQELKRDYQNRPDLRDGAFRDVALSESGRDFQRSASCASLSGGCAPDAKTSYRKGDAVPPEELAAIHRRVHGGDPDEDFIDDGPGDEWETAAPAAGSIASAGPSPVIARRNAVLRALESLTGGGEAVKNTSGGPGAASAAKRAWGDVPGAAIMALEKGRGRLSAAGAVFFALALLVLLRRST